MDPASPAETTAFVVRVQPGADHAWYVSVAGPREEGVFPLAPLTLLIQLWRPQEANLIRATLRLHGSEHSVSIQSSRQLEELVRAWLLPEGAQEG